MFCYKKDTLILQQGDQHIPIKDLVKNRNQACYLYDIYGIRSWYKYFLQATNHQLKIFFAMKSNFNLEVLKTFQKQGSGIDVVSIGEVRRAQEAGFLYKDIVFSGVGKNFEELSLAVKDDYFQINVESFQELQRLAHICKIQNKSCAIGLRVNPNIRCETHPYIQTGLQGHKFGFLESEIPNLLQYITKNPCLKLQSLSMHIGSQIQDLEPFIQAISCLKDLYISVKKQGYPLQVMDIGGGLGINYNHPNFEEEKIKITRFGEALKNILTGFDDQVIMEPGRFLIARHGVLCAQVEYIKKTPTKTFIILNSGMNHFLRPALYKAKHRILSLSNPYGKPVKKYDIVGPICETGDTLVQDYLLPETQAGSWLLIADTGAYGFVMANSYNLQYPIEEIAIDHGSIL